MNTWIIRLSRQLKGFGRSISVIGTISITALVLSGCVPQGLIKTNTNLTWVPSCKSPAQRIENGYRFRTFENTCSGGTYGQRDEINTTKFSRRSTDKYVFSTTLRFISDYNYQAKIFQIHDNTVEGCPPPLSIAVTQNSLLLRSGYKVMVDNDVICPELTINDSKRFGRPSGNFDLKRDGTPYDFRVEIEFLGDERFYVEVFVDGKLVTGGKYDPDVENPAFKHSKSFYFKHGLYSKHMFDYVLESTNISLMKISQ